MSRYFEELVQGVTSYKEENLHDDDKIYLSGYKQAIEDLKTASENIIDQICNPLADLPFFIPDENEAKVLGGRDKLFSKILAENIRADLEQNIYEIIVSCIDSYEEEE